MDLENMKYNSKDKIFHNKCKFCGKDLKPIGLDYFICKYAFNFNRV